MTRLIVLRGKHAKGPHRYALVDDDVFEDLNQHAWKAKPNGSNNNIYAIRAVMCDDGKTRDIRMHRVVMGYYGPLDIDHINHNGLDNRRINLRVTTRSVNTLNQRIVERSCCCRQCGIGFQVTQKIGARPPGYCGDACIKERDKPLREKAKAMRSLLKAERNALMAERMSRPCNHCGDVFIASKASHIFCCESCKKSAKWRRLVASGKKSPSAMRSAEYGRQRRILIKSGQWKFAGPYGDL